MSSVIGTTRYLQAIWKLRYFWMSLVHIDLRARYRRSVMGVGWSLLNPILMTCVLCTVFTTIFNASLAEYAPYLLIGITFWNFVSNCVKEGCNSLFQSEHYIRQHPAPMAIYPLRTALGASFHFVLALGVAIVLTAAVRGVPAALPALSLVPTVIMLFAFGWALATIAAFANAFFPDTHQMTEVGLQIVFYGTPIIYPESVLQERGLTWISLYNPLGAFLELLRAPLMRSELASGDAYLVATLTTAVVIVLAGAILSKYQRTIIFQL